jgi:hypothetical protein
MKLHSFFASEKNNPSRLSDSKSCESEGIYTNKIVHSLQYHHIIVKLNKQILYIFFHDIIDQLQQKYKHNSTKGSILIFYRNEKNLLVIN